MDVMNRRPITLGDLRWNEDREVFVAEISFDHKLAHAWATEAVRDAKRELTAMLVQHVMRAMKDDHDAFLRLAIDSITSAVKDEVAKAVADRLSGAK